MRNAGCWGTIENPLPGREAISDSEVLSKLADLITDNPMLMKLHDKEREKGYSARLSVLELMLLVAEDELVLEKIKDKQRGIQ
jgi:hypothetical protein